MKTCFNITCNAKVLALYPDEHGNPGRVCQACFTPPVIKKAHMLSPIMNPKTLQCGYRPCNKTFTQTTMRQVECSEKCKSKSRNLRSKAYKLRRKEREATNG